MKDKEQVDFDHDIEHAFKKLVRRWLVRGPNGSWQLQSSSNKHIRKKRSYTGDDRFLDLANNKRIRVTMNKGQDEEKNADVGCRRWVHHDSDLNEKSSLPESQWGPRNRDSSLCSRPKRLCRATPVANSSRGTHSGEQNDSKGKKLAGRSATGHRRENFGHVKFSRTRVQGALQDDDDVDACFIDRSMPKWVTTGETGYGTHVSARESSASESSTRDVFASKAMEMPSGVLALNAMIHGPNGNTMSNRMHKASQAPKLKSRKNREHVVSFGKLSSVRDQSKSDVDCPNVSLTEMKVRDKKTLTKLTTRSMIAEAAASTMNNHLSRIRIRVQMSSRKIIGVLRDRRQKTSKRAMNPSRIELSACTESLDATAVKVEVSRAFSASTTPPRATPTAVSDAWQMSDLPKLFQSGCKREEWAVETKLERLKMLVGMPTMSKLDERQQIAQIKTEPTISMLDKKQQKTPAESPPVCKVRRCYRPVSSDGYCAAHSQRKRCKLSDCSNLVASRGLCCQHGGRTKCQVNGCTKNAYQNKLCSKHGGRPICSIEGCENFVRLRGHCKLHLDSNHL